MAGNRRQFLFSPTMSNRFGGGIRSHDVSGSEFSSLNGDLYHQENELICDECHYPKRHADMTWWWDEQCTITVCEHCCMSNHRNHRLKPQNDAEREEMGSYERFLLDIQSLTCQILKDIVDQREMLKDVCTNLNDMQGVGNAVRSFIGKYECQLKGIKEEILTARDLRLTNDSYLKRNEIRRKTKQILDIVDDGLKDFAPRLDKLVKQFHQMKSVLTRWEHEGLTALEYDGDADKE